MGLIGSWQKACISMSSNARERILFFMIYVLLPTLSKCSFRLNLHIHRVSARSYLYSVPLKAVHTAGFTKAAPRLHFSKAHILRVQTGNSWLFARQSIRPRLQVMLVL